MQKVKDLELKQQNTLGFLRHSHRQTIVVAKAALNQNTFPKATNVSI